MFCVVTPGRSLTLGVFVAVGTVLPHVGTNVDLLGRVTVVSDFDDVLCASLTLIFVNCTSPRVVEHDEGVKVPFPGICVDLGLREVDSV